MATPDFDEGAIMPYLSGMANVKDKVDILLDIDQLLTSQEMHGLRPY